MFHKELLKLYFICRTTTCQGKNLYTVVEEALKGGITLFQFREKGEGALEGLEKGEGALEGLEKLELAIQIKELCKKYNVPFIVNDDIDLAMEIDADGVHVGQDDIGVDEIRKLMPDKIIGLSIRNEEEFQQSKVEYVDYVGVGPVFDTQSKDDAGGAIGYEGLELMRKLLPQMPLVAIGGIQTKHIKDIIKTNMDGVSIISAISYAKNIEKTVREMSEQ
ncbi:thiamine phosphate synthase [Streptococcus pneumoniae]|uniref:thiamine phosphate synthase n=1 Tax=Streptococcus pneumoniae TaxID=1313 RepID=UPI00406936AA